MGKRDGKASERGQTVEISDHQPDQNSDVVELEGTVIEQLPNAIFRVALNTGQKVLAHTSGTMRRVSIRILPGDRVVVALSPYDQTRGRIVRRHK